MTDVAIEETITDVERPISTIGTTASHIPMEPAGLPPEDAPAGQAARPIYDDERIDEFARSIFAHLGYDEITQTMADVYMRFKRIKDSQQTGRLTPEGFALVVVVSELTNGEFSPGSKNEG